MLFVIAAYHNGVAPSQEFDRKVIENEFSLVVSKWWSQRAREHARQLLDSVRADYGEVRSASVVDYIALIFVGVFSIQSFRRRPIRYLRI